MMVETEISKICSRLENLERADRMRLGISKLMTLAGFVVAILAIGAIYFSTWTNGKVQTDRIAACSKSDDVVGCLKAVK